MAKVALKRIPNLCECGNHAWMPLNKWGVTLVDVEDAALLHERRWSIGGSSTPYAHAFRRGALHRLIATPPEGLYVDHINHNSLDNRRLNLRLATPCQNNANRKKRVASSSRFKGVNPVQRQNDIGWYARIKVNGRCQHLGIFDDEDDAAAAYDRAAVRLHGEFAMTNRKLGLL